MCLKLGLKKKQIKFELEIKEPLVKNFYNIQSLHLRLSVCALHLVTSLLIASMFATSFYHYGTVRAKPL